MKNNDFKNQEKNEDFIGSTLRTGLRDLPQTKTNFVSNVMRRVEELETTPSFPLALWAVPAVLAALTIAVSVWGIQHEAQTQSPTLDEMLLIDMPAETQGLLTRSPSFSNILWNATQGGFLP
ncbi:MAG TPA: hypothetical protein PLY88_08635 [Candidatus Omnitrophota bacterium]|nr:hypothetical protein [Candidatus Omnitrophota bacterium]